MYVCGNQLQEGFLKWKKVLWFQMLTHKSNLPPPSVCKWVCQWPVFIQESICEVKWSVSEVNSINQITYFKNRSFRS